MIIEIPVEWGECFCILLWSILMMVVGYALSLPTSQNLETILRYIKHDEDDSWIHYSYYQELEEEMKELEKKKEESENMIERLKKETIDISDQNRAYKTQIECLRAEICVLNTKKSEAKK